MKRLVQRHARIALAITTACSLLALLAGSLQVINAATAGASQKPSSGAALKELYSKAKAEGAVTWEVGSPTPEYAPIVNAFEKKYPGITVNLINLQGPQVPGQVIAEGKSVDFTVATLTSDQIGGQLLKEKLVARENWKKYGVPKTKIVDDRYLLHAYDFPIGWFYNTKNLTRKTVPKSMNELLKPKWSGDKVAINGLGIINTEAYYSVGHWNKKKYMSDLEAMKAQNWPEVIAGATLLQDVASGEYDLGMTALLQLPLYIKTKGAPLAIAPISPITVRPAGPAVLADAAHPAAAVLLSTFLASKSVEQLWASIGFGLVSPCNASPIASLICKSHAKVVYVKSIAEAKRFTEAVTLNAQVFKAT